MADLRNPIKHRDITYGRGADSGLLCNLHRTIRLPQEKLSNNVTLPLKLSQMSRVSYKNWISKLQYGLNSYGRLSSVVEQSRRLVLFSFFGKIVIYIMAF
jgi:hypothetical protein